MNKIVFPGTGMLAGVLGSRRLSINLHSHGAFQLCRKLCNRKLPWSKTISGFMPKPWQ